jgi:integrase
MCSRWMLVAKTRLIPLLPNKNGERRSVPLSGKAFDLLTDLKKIRQPKATFVFPHKDGTRPVNIRNNWEKAVAKAELNDFRFHDLRHTAASYLAMSGASLLEIAHILGHKKPAMTMRYSHLTKNHTAGVLERMNEAQFLEAE